MLPKKIAILFVFLAALLSCDPEVKNNNTKNIKTQKDEIVISGSVTIASVGSGIYKTNDTIEIILFFDSPVTVMDLKETPRIALNIGNSARYADYKSGSGEASLTFGYTVDSTDNDDDGIDMASFIELNGASLKDSEGEDVHVVFITPNNLNKVLIDNVAPSISQVSFENGNYQAMEYLDIEVSFSERVTVSSSGGTPRIALNIGGEAKYADYRSGNGTSRLLFSYLVAETDSDSDGVELAALIDLNGGHIRDIADNPSNLGFEGPAQWEEVFIDHMAPTISGVSVLSKNYSINDSVDVVVQFNEDVVVDMAHGLPQIALTVGNERRYAHYQSGGGATLIFRYIISKKDNDSDGIDMASTIISNGGIIRDHAGNNAELDFTLPTNLGNVLIDHISPIISKIGVASGNYRLGENIDIVLSFNESINVDTSLGNPRIALNIGGAAKFAEYVNGHGTSGLLFRYTILAIDSDSDGIEISTPSIDLNQSTIADAAGNAAILAFTYPGNLNRVFIDNAAPILLSAVVSSGVYKANENIDITLSYNEELKVDTSSGMPYIALNIGGVTKRALYHSQTGRGAITFRYTIKSNDNDPSGIELGDRIILNGGALSDRIGNAVSTVVPSPSNLSDVLVDTTIPKIRSITLADGNYSEGDALDISVLFNEPVNVNSSIPFITLNIDDTIRYARYQSGPNSSTLVFRYQVTSADNDKDGITMAPNLNPSAGTITDNAGNLALLHFLPPANLQRVIIDTTRPRITSTVALEGSYRKGMNLTIRAVFDEVVNLDISLGSPRLPLDIGGSTKYAIYQSTLDDALEFNYQIITSDSDSDGISLGNALDLNGATIKDNAGNDLTLDIPNGGLGSILIDNTHPNIEAVALANGYYRGGEKMEITVTFNEKVTINSIDSGLPQIPLTIGLATRYAIYQSGSGSRKFLFSYTIASDDSDENGVAITPNIDLRGSSIVDSAGNAATLTFTAPSNLSNVIVDNTIPTITSTAITDGDYKARDNLDITVSFSETVLVDMNESGPLIALSLGNDTKYASYQSGSNSDTLIFRYVIANGDNDINGINMTGPIVFNGGSIKDLANNNANGNFTLPSNLDQVLVDTIPASVVKASIPYGNFNSTENIDLSVVFSEIVVVDQNSPTPRIALDIGGTTKYADYALGTGSSILVFRYSIVVGDNDNDGIGIAEAIENAGSIQDRAGNSTIYNLASLNNLDLVLVNTGIDTINPSISSVTITNGNYKTGKALNISLQFSENVAVDVTSGTPSLTLIIGDSTKQASYSLGTGNSVLVFSYTVVSGDEDLDGISIATPIALNGALIQDSAKNNATLNFTVPDNLQYIRVNDVADVVPPTITSVGVSDGNYALNQSIDFEVIFDEVIWVDTTYGAPHIPLIVGAHRRYASYQSGRGSRNLIFRYVVSGDDDDNDGIEVSNSIALNGGSVQDVSGNDAILNFTSPVTGKVVADGMGPAIIKSSILGGNYVMGDRIEIALEFNENIFLNGAFLRIALDIGRSKEVCHLSKRPWNIHLIFFLHRRYREKR